MIDEQFKTYFKFPLIYKENFLYVLTNDRQMALTWLKDSSEIEDPFEIVNKMNGYSNKQFKEKWTIKDNVFIYYGDQKLFLIRGWGRLTGLKYNLTPSLAAKIQDNFAKYLINNLNK